MCEIAVELQNWGTVQLNLPPHPASYKIMKNCVNFLDRHFSLSSWKTREGNKNVTVSGYSNVSLERPTDVASGV